MFSDNLNKQTRYSACMQHLETSKETANKQTNGYKTRKEVPLMFLECQMQEPMYVWCVQM